MMKTLLLLSIMLGTCHILPAQSWSQWTSTDLELPNSEAVIKHGSSWYMAIAGGVFKTTDNGQNWSLTNNNLSSVFNDLRIEGFTSFGPTLLGVNRWQGVVTTTIGSTWTLANSGLPPNRYISSNLAVLGTRIFAAVQDNDDGKYYLYYSDNSGTLWTQGTEIPVVDGNLAIYSNGTVLYLILESNSGVDTFLKETSDGITLSDPSFSSSFPGTDIENIVVSGGNLMVFGESSVYRYNTSGATWSDLSSVWTNGLAFIAGNGNGNDRLYATVLEGNMNIGAYTSTNDGDSWLPLSPTMVLGQPFAQGFYATGDEFMACFIDDGMHYSSDAGANIIRSNTGALATDFDELFVSGTNILSSLFISGVYGSSDNGSSWAKWNTGLSDDPLQRVYNYMSDGNSLYVNYSNMPDDRPQPYKAYNSSDNGATWSELTMPGTATDLQLIGVNGSTLFAHSENLSPSYYISSSGGTSWTNITANIPANFEVNFVCGDGTTAYLAGYDISVPNPVTNIYTSSDNGVSGWTLTMDGITMGDLEPRQYEDEEILLITPSPGMAFLEITYTNWNRKLLRWNTGSSLWEEVTAAGLDYVDFETMAYNNGDLFVSKWNNGVYKSSNNGESFSKLNGLPDGLHAQAIVFMGDLLVISTRRGIWSYDLATDTPEAIKLQGTMLHPNPAKDIVHVDAAVNEVTIYSLTGAIIAQKTVNNGRIDIRDLPNGIYLIQVGARTEKLLKQ